MIRDRILLLAGGLLTLACTLVLMLWGNSLVRAFEVLTMPIPVDGQDALLSRIDELRHDLSLSSLAALGLGLGLGLTAYAIFLSQKRRRLPWPAKIGAILGGVLLCVSGALLLVAFREIQEALTVIAMSADVPEPTTISTVIHTGIRHSSPAFFTLFSAQLVLAISMGPLFWSDPREERRSGLSFPVLVLSLLTAAAVALLLAFSAVNANAALRMIAEGAIIPVKPAELAAALSRTTIYALLAGGALFVYGAATGLRGMLFPAE